MCLRLLHPPLRLLQHLRRSNPAVRLRWWTAVSTWDAQKPSSWQGSRRNVWSSVSLVAISMPSAVDSICRSSQGWITPSSLAIVRGMQRRTSMLRSLVSHLASGSSRTSYTTWPISFLCYPRMAADMRALRPLTAAALHAAMCPSHKHSSRLHLFLFHTSVLVSAIVIAINCSYRPLPWPSAQCPPHITVCPYHAPAEPQAPIETCLAFRPSNTHVLPKPLATRPEATTAAVCSNTNDS